MFYTNFSSSEVWLKRCLMSPTQQNSFRSKWQLFWQKMPGKIQFFLVGIKISPDVPELFVNLLLFPFSFFCFCKKHFKIMHILKKIWKKKTHWKFRQNLRENCGILLFNCRYHMILVLELTRGYVLQIENFQLLSNGSFGSGLLCNSIGGLHFCDYGLHQVHPWHKYLDWSPPK